MSNIIREQPCKAEIGDFGSMTAIKKYIASFDIPMHNVWLHLAVKICKATRNSKRNLASYTPTKLASPLLFAMQDSGEAIVFHVFIHHNSMHSLGAESAKLDKIFVLDIGQGSNL